MRKQAGGPRASADDVRRELAQVFAARIRAAAALGEERGATATARLELEAAADELGAEMARHAAECLAAFVDERMQKAVAERRVLRERWPLGLGGQPGVRVRAALGEVLGACEEAGETGAEGAWKWPPEAAPRDVAEWAATSQPAVGKVLAQAAAEDKTPSSVAIGPLEVSTYALALLFLAMREVEQDRARPTVRFGANRYARAAMQVMSVGQDLLKRHEDRGLAQVAMDGTGRLAIDWMGGKVPVQLALAWGRDLPMAALRGILDSLHEDGVRDWLLLHRMDAEQGWTGEFTWTWREHRERSAYARRVGQRRASDEQLQREVSERLRMLHNAELRIQVEEPFKRETVTKWMRVGKHGLIDIPMGVDSLNGALAARISILPELRGRGEKGGPGPSFALVSEEALMMSGGELRLAAVLGCERTYAVEEGGVLVRKARYLWETSTLRGGEPPRKRWPEATSSLERILDRLAQAGEFGDWRRLDGEDVTPESRYEIRPPQWWRDQVVHRVPPALRAATVGIPRTGLELKVWREARGWSQLEAARRLGVGQATISRSEAGGAATLGERLRTQLRGV